MTRRRQILDLLGVAFLLAFMVVSYFLLPETPRQRGAGLPPASRNVQSVEGGAASDVPAVPPVSSRRRAR